MKRIFKNRPKVALMMIPFVKIPLKDAQKVKKALLEEDAFEQQYHYIKEDGFIYYPINKNWKKLGLEYETVQKAGKKINKPKSLKKALSSTFSDKELEDLKRSYDTIGTIAVLEIDDELRPKEDIIAKTLLETNKQIKTVVAKDGIHEGEFRKQSHRYLAGEKTFLTVHKENGCSLYVDVNATYFSPRLSTERKRIAELIKPGEKVLVMFSGCGPYPCVFAKNTQAKLIVGVEKNPEAHDLGLRNIELNKLKNVELHCGDVISTVSKLGKFDRVLMPLPKSAEDFLSVGIPALKKGGTLHFYDFLHEELFEDAKAKITKACRSLKRHADFVTVVRCGQHAPHIYRICVDAVLE